MLCRAALDSHTIDAASFTMIRLLSGAVMLALLVAIPQRKAPWSVDGNLISALALFVYAIAFSFAYLSLGAGTGALILFTFVQITMLAIGIIKGEHPKPLEIVGMLVALGGVVYLVLPGLKAPPLLSAALMACAGAAWGLYSFRGRSAPNAIAATAGNMAIAAPFGLLVWLTTGAHTDWAPRGALLAAISGAITSGLGYVCWYKALPGLSSTRAAVVQLSVPALTAVGAVLILNEEFTPRRVAATVLTLGGVAITIAAHQMKRDG
ncbi:MAG: DMT family transporter [Armatimonadetes bacterium]|nr:DMT family transporter [Armatimonadota bacterium]